jgi:citronellol/citronellal dehydrogenase
MFCLSPGVIGDALRSARVAGPGLNLAHRLSFAGASAREVADMGALDGRVAIVTGASRGLGKDIALALAREGASVAVSARTDAEGQSRIPGTLADTVGLIKDAGGEATAIRCDVANEDDITNLVQQTLDAYGRIDTLVNNAGILVPGTVMEMEPKHWRLSFRVNVEGPFLLCKAVLPHMVAAGGGHIINVSSRGAIGPGPGPYDTFRPTGGAAYGSTKAALERFPQGLASEVFHHRVSVNALSPHLPIWSEGGHYFRTRGGEPDYAGWRMSGEIIGDAAVVICSQEPGRYTGNILYDELVMLKEGGLSAEEVAAKYPVEG